MKKVNLPWLLPIALLVGGIFLFFQTAENAQSAPAAHVVISEVQIAGASADDEFVELYNPTSFPIDLSGWRLRRETPAGGEGGNLASSISGFIPANGFFLIAPDEDYEGTVSPDQNYSTGSRIAANNTVLLYSDAGVTLVDKVGVGEGASTAEEIGAATPSAGQSVERKAKETSISESMSLGGADEFEGNSEDTDNNSQDFVLREVSQPQNSLSEPELISIVSPTTTPTATSEPSQTPVPTATPTDVSSPTVTSTPTASPTSSPSPAPKQYAPFPGYVMNCSVQTRIFNFGFFNIHVNFPVCRLERV